MNQLKKWGFALTAAAMTFSVSAQELTMGDVVEKYEQAGTLLNDKKFAEAIPVLEETIKLGQDVGGDALNIVSDAQNYLVLAYYQKGAVAMQEKKFNTALAAFEKAEELGELYDNLPVMRQAARVSSMIYMNQGVQSFNEKNYTEALETFQKGYEKDPNNPKLTYFMAKSNAELGSLDKAVELYNQVIEAGTANSKYAEDAKNARTDADYYVLVAASEAAKAGNMDELVKYAAMIPNNADAGLLMVQTANNKKMYDAVIGDGTAAYEAQTDAAKKSEVAYLLGVAYQNKGNNAKSAEWLRKVTAGGNVAAAKALLAEVTR